jgi:hypothetical protein
MLFHSVYAVRMLCGDVVQVRVRDREAMLVVGDPSPHKHG